MTSGSTSASSNVKQPIKPSQPPPGKLNPKAKHAGVKVDASLLFAAEDVHTLPPVVTSAMPPPIVSTHLAKTTTAVGDHQQHPNATKRRRGKKGQTKASMARLEFLNKKVNADMIRDRGNFGLTMTENEYMVHLASTSGSTGGAISQTQGFYRSKKVTPYTSNTSFNPSTLRYDTQTLNEGAKAPTFLNTVYNTRRADLDREKQQQTVTMVNLDETASLDTPETQSTRISKKIPESNSTTNPLQGEIEQIRGYLDMLDQYSLHNFLIWKGACVTNTPEFSSFKRKYDSYWGSILSVLDSLEKLMKSFEIPLAVIDGAKVADLAACDAPIIEQEDLFECISNLDQVLPIIESKSSSDLIFGKKGSAKYVRSSVIKIQTWIRKELTMRWYIREILRRRAATYIQTEWRRVSSEWRVREMLRVREGTRRIQWDKLCEMFRSYWKTKFDPDIAHDRDNPRPKVIVHVPSLSLEEYLRLGLPRFPISQNLQLQRLVDINNEDVEVVYVSPFPLDDEIVDYYKKILQIGGIDSPSSKFTVVVPENKDIFPSHFPLSSILMYSPHAVHRIKQICRGKSAYIVGGVQGWQEKRLGLELNLPVFQPDLQVGNLYSTRGGAKRAFISADVSVPVGAHDIYDEEDFVIALTKLIASNLDVSRWMFRIDADYNNVGCAYFDVEHLKCVADLRKEREQLYLIHKGDVSVWHHPDVQLLARAKILKDLRSMLHLKGVCCGKEMFYSFKQFLAHFMRVGGVIEAEPVGVIGRPSINMMITPLGEVRIESCVDLLVDDESTVIGSSFPVKSVPLKALEGAGLAVSKELVEKGMIGYYSINFVAYRIKGEDGQKGSLRMVGMAIEPQLTTAAITYKFVKYVCGEASLGRGVKLSRSYAVIDAMFNPSLGSVQYGSFFKLCRMQAVSFDLESLSGLMFLLFDTLSAGVLGMIAVGGTVAESLERLSGGFSFVKQNVGTPAAYNEVNLKDLDGYGDDAGEGMVSFVRTMKSVEETAAKA
eukprot:CAMPEP_0118660132 /NCGR_PEP_ID=MMETSP0785-20121206/15500_1 /TAXON_ID=91992 /ORGANISM="Bolidomonas pacifica, Strain CCMP 1866" /LENGTH=999 /DNA_ID=CAMNT_0006553319 /DNA_START=29 /DNA_END=3024 /DNA_ORIENTATION=+